MNGFFTKDEVMATLGCKSSTYYLVRKKNLLGYSRLYPGGPVVHTQEHLDRYREYLNSLGQVSKGIEAGIKSVPQLKSGRAVSR